MECLPGLEGRVAELADARALGAREVIRAGSTPVAPTTQRLSETELSQSELAVLPVTLLNLRSSVKFWFCLQTAVTRLSRL